MKWNKMKNYFLQQRKIQIKRQLRVCYEYSSRYRRIFNCIVNVTIITPHTISM